MQSRGVINPANGASMSREAGAMSSRLNTVGLSERELHSLWADLDREGETSTAPFKREFARWPFRRLTVAAEITHPGGTITRLKLACRNLSKGGIGLLHGGFLHQGSLCRVWLPKLNGGTIEVQGVVTRCMHRRGAVHEIGVKFDKAIDLTQFIKGSRYGNFHTIERVEADKLVGRMLYVEDSESDIRIMRHFLRETAVTVRTVSGTDHAIQEAKQGFDVIVAHWSADGEKGTDLIRMLRREGIKTPAIVVTKDPVGLVREGLGDLHDIGVLAMPLSQGELLRMLAEKLTVHGNVARHPNADETLFARLSGEMNKLVENLRRAIATRDQLACRVSTMQIKAIAPLMGMNETVRLCDETTERLARGERLEPESFLGIVEFAAKAA